FPLPAVERTLKRVVHHVSLCSQGRHRSPTGVDAISYCYMSCLCVHVDVCVHVCVRVCVCVCVCVQDTQVMPVLPQLVVTYSVYVCVCVRICSCMCVVGHRCCQSCPSRW